MYHFRPVSKKVFRAGKSIYFQGGNKVYKWGNLHVNHNVLKAQSYVFKRQSKLFFQLLLTPLLSIKFNFLPEKIRFQIDSNLL